MNCTRPHSYFPHPKCCHATCYFWLRKGRSNDQHRCKPTLTPAYPGFGFPIATPTSPSGVLSTWLAAMALLSTQQDQIQRENQHPNFQLSQHRRLDPCLPWQQNKGGQGLKPRIELPSSYLAQRPILRGDPSSVAGLPSGQGLMA